MKIHILRLSIILCAFQPLKTNAQDNSITISEPEYIGDIVYVNGNTGIPLEKQKSSAKAKAGASMYIVGAGKVKSTNIVDGIESPTRISKRDSIQLIVRVSDNNIDPFQIINIFKLEQNLKKGYRFIEVGSAATFKGSSAMEINFLTFEAKKYGTNSYLILFPNKLEPGEYAITLEGSRDVFKLFGID